MSEVVVRLLQHTNRADDAIHKITANKMAKGVFSSICDERESGWSRVSAVRNYPSACDEILIWLLKRKKTSFFELKTIEESLRFCNYSDHVIGRVANWENTSSAFTLPWSSCASVIWNSFSMHAIVHRIRSLSSLIIESTRHSAPCHLIGAFKSRDVRRIAIPNLDARRKQWLADDLSVWKFRQRHSATHGRFRRAVTWEMRPFVAEAASDNLQGRQLRRRLTGRKSIPPQPNISSWKTWKAKRWKTGGMCCFAMRNSQFISRFRNLLRFRALLACWEWTKKSKEGSNCVRQRKIP